MKRLMPLLALVAAAFLALAPLPAGAETPPTAPAAGAAPAAASGAPAAPAPTSPAPAPTAAAPAPSPKKVSGRVLRACQFGDCDDLVDLPADVAKEAERQGLIDTHKDAVTHARTLDQNKPKPKPDAA